MWAVKLYESFSLSKLSRHGIYPREWDGILGIITGPFVHSDYEHLLSNTVPIFMLSAVVVYFYRRVAVPTLFLIQLLTGFAVWLFARPSYHIGASGVVYGLVSFVFWSGIFRRNMKSIVLALSALVLYSGYFHGILPTKDGVSWESHLFGAIVGIFTAFLFKGLKEDDEMVENPWEEDETREYFLPRDTFDMTKKERAYQAYLEKLRQAENTDDHWTDSSTLL